MNDTMPDSPAKPKRARNSKTISLGDKMSVIATVLAVASLLISIRSCQQADRSVDLADREYNAARDFSWCGKIVDTNSLQLEPWNHDAKIEELKVSFPEYYSMHSDMRFGNDDELAEPFILPLQVCRPHIIALWTNGTFYRNVHASIITNKESTFYATQSAQGGIPIAIKTRYRLKGERYDTAAIYRLPYSLISYYDPATNGTRVAEHQVMFYPLQYLGPISEPEAKQRIEDFQLKEKNQISN